MGFLYGNLRWAIIDTTDGCYYSTYGEFDGGVNVEEMDITDTYGSEEEASKAIEKYCRKYPVFNNRLKPIKVRYDFHEYDENRDWDLPVDDNIYVAIR